MIVRIKDTINKVATTTKVETITKDGKTTPTKFGGTTITEEAETTMETRGGITAIDSRIRTNLTELLT